MSGTFRNFSLGPELYTAPVIQSPTYRQTPIALPSVNLSTALSPVQADGQITLNMGNYSSDNLDSYKSCALRRKAPIPATGLIKS